jgi:uncharacterized repeat protein (TIGR03803 family)
MPVNLAQTLRRLLTVAVVAFTLAASAWASPKFRIIHTFTGGNDAWFPTGVLTFDSAGNLYGTSIYGGSTTACGGVYGCGTVFRLVPKNGHWIENLLTNFGNATGQVGPSGPLVFDSAGNLYGIGTFNYYDNGQVFLGQLFQLVNGGGSYTESTLHFFVGGNNDGGVANPGLVRDTAGNLYGSAQAGGDLNNNGVIFEFSPNGDGTWTETFPYQFGQGKSYIPTGNMVIDKAGNLYGTTANGGAYGYGSVYKLSQASGVWTIESLYDFTPSPNYGQYPTPGGLVMDAAGNLYGNTQYDGFYGVGSLYKLTPTAGYWKFSLVHSFTGSTDGGYPAGGLAVDPSGNIYGTTYTGGLFQYGTVYKFVRGPKGSWNETVLHNFAATTDGYQAQGVILDSLGNVYGVAEYGGANLDGVAYEITP